MKEFSTYQYLEGEPMTERDKKEIGSKFWNEGKWENFIVPLLSDNCEEMTLIDVGCNAGLFLKLAEEKGFKKVIGIDSNEKAVKKGLDYRDRNGYSYDIFNIKMEEYLDKVPVADYTILVNSHYYFPISDWFDYLDKLKAKTRFCLIVTTEQKERTHLASADPKEIRNYFRDWEELKGVDCVLPDNDPSPRKLQTLLFKSPILERVSLDTLYNRNKLDNFYQEILQGIDPFNTTYYKVVRKLRINKQKRWNEKMVKDFISGKIKLFEEIKEFGMKKPLIVNHKNKVVDGSHRSAILDFLGEKTAIIRKIWN